MSQEQIAALRAAIALTPDNHTLRLMLANLLQSNNQAADALVEYKILLDANQLPAAQLVSTGNLALAESELDIVSRCLDEAIKTGVIEGVAGLRAKLDDKLAEAGYVRIVQPLNDAPQGLSELDTFQEEEMLTFADIGGLKDVKKAVHKTIILPLLRPDVYRKYGRKPGGGILLYGPPGCGKTLLARAAAGECSLPFFNVRIEDILDPYMGISEKNLHRVFEHARLNAPCVLFIDELDAIAFARRKRTSSVGRSLVDQLLQELDAIGADNKELLILAATNSPWDLDDALLRPGRFDRRIFVSPPDAKARQHILEIMLKAIPTAKLNLKQLTKGTPLFSGADLRVLVDQAVDLVIDEALESREEPPLNMGHLEKALATLQPTTLDWLERAQNYVEFANQDKRYNDVAAYLKSREVRKWRT
ncbi:MAG: ATP-binding protein [Chloroflexi bacterium]|nr:ATP-binding protein [Chloroflexota bacterium]